MNARISRSRHCAFGRVPPVNMVKASNRVDMVYGWVVSSRNGLDTAYTVSFWTADSSI